MFVNENEKNYIKIIIPFNIKNHIPISISVQLIAIRYLFKISQP